MSQPNARIPKNYPLMEDDGGNAIGYDMGAGAGVEIPLCTVLIDVSTNAVKGGFVNSFGRNFLLTRANTKEVSAITHGSANLKVSHTPKGTAVASRTVIKTVAVQTNLDGDSATDLTLFDNKPLVTEGGTVLVEITDGSDASGLLLVTIHGIEINTQDAASYD